MWKLAKSTGCYRQDWREVCSFMQAGGKQKYTVTGPHDLMAVTYEISVGLI